MTDKYGNEINVGDYVAFAFYDEENVECYIFKSPIIRICEESHSVVLDVRDAEILDCSVYEYGIDDDDNVLYIDELTRHQSDIILVQKVDSKLPTN